VLAYFASVVFVETVKTVAALKTVLIAPIASVATAVTKIYYHFSEWIIDQ